ncbi:hypothetical protein SSYRP_v1c05690 [Spiroplasma syrphidicola EA-1]|uniref:Rod shape-determining protein MreD n=1 Tax=Spiroplasma syrphidicola EA-1 TaxID=1276229 RepID=R4UE41_9MOLU|nr:hypothetical protein [Spiroplasma syrphidicola]AGM26159.1 hypothetical protein SSYRP_v1c05690 [Spiroplasma syrphidicola EA-1]
MIEKNSNCGVTFKPIFEIAIIALLSSFTFVLNLVFRFIPGFNFLPFMVIITTIVFRYNIALGVINISSILQFLLESAVIEMVFIMLLYNLYGILIFILRKYLIRWWWILIILMPILILGMRLTNYLVWLLIHNLATANALFIQNTLKDDILFTLYLILPFTLYPLFWRVLMLYQNKWPFLFNKFFLNAKKVNLYQRKKNHKNILQQKGTRYEE